MLALMLYLALGGSFVFGGMVLSEIGRYELWDSKKRFTLSFGLGATMFLLSSVGFFFDGGAFLYPFIFFLVFGAAKLGVKALNSAMPEKFQPTSEELKQKHSNMFRVNASEIEEILKGELEFIQKLGMGVEIPCVETGSAESPAEKDASSELGELRRVIKKFLEKKEKWE